MSHTNWWRIRNRILIPAATAGIGIAAYLATLAPTPKATAIADLEAAAQDSPALIPLIRRVCPDCNISKRRSVWRIAPRSICRWQAGGWVHCGPGVGCDAPCPVPDPTIAPYEELPRRGRHRGWGKRVRRLLDAGDTKIMRKVIRREVQRKRQEANGGAQVPFEGGTKKIRK